MLRATRRGRARSTTPGHNQNLYCKDFILKVTFSGKVEKRNYTKGELHGPATITWQTGDVFEFSYKNGNMEVTSDDDDDDDDHQRVAGQRSVPLSHRNQ